MPAPIPFTAATQFATPPIDTNPQNFTDAVAALNSLVSTTIAGSATIYTIGSATPGVDDQDKLWVKLAGSDSHLVGVFYYWQGYWRRINTPRANSIHFFAGNPATYFNSNGTGIKGLDYDGYVLCDGRNGTADLSDKFIVVAHLTAPMSGFNGSTWETHIEGAPHTAGGDDESAFSITNDNLPTISLDGSAIQTSGNHTDRHIIIDDDYSTVNTKQTTVTLAGKDTPDPITVPHIPPYYALALVAWLGYEAY
jgi:hypothetical protein